MATLVPNIRRINLPLVGSTLSNVRKQWPAIQRSLIDAKVGGKEPPFDAQVQANMIRAYTYVDGLLETEVVPFFDLSKILEINNLIHYGDNNALRFEYHEALRQNRERFYSLAPTLEAWYEKHVRRGDHPMKIAAEIYVSVLGYPQLFNEGNHRTGALLSSWINMYYGFPPFVLSEANALAYFEPSSQIKFFTDKTSWRSFYKLPKYKKSFRRLWEELVDGRYVR